MNVCTIQTGSGKGRDPWAIRRHLATITIVVGGETHHGVSLRLVAQLANTYPNAVCDTVKGIRNHKETLRVLEEELNVPRKLLYPTECEADKAA